MSDHRVETLGQKIKRLRSSLGMTQKQLADGFVTVAMISAVETDKGKPSIDLLQHLARKLQVPLQELANQEHQHMANTNKHKLA